MRNVPDEVCRKIQNIYFMFNNLFFPQNCAVCERKCENFVEQVRPQMALWGMRIACSIHKATHTHSEYVVHFAATMVAQTCLIVTFKRA